MGITIALSTFIITLLVILSQTVLKDETIKR